VSSPGPVLVSGATGLIGRRVVQRLLEAGGEVRALTRRPGSAALPGGAEATRWDGVNPPREALLGARSIVHLSGEPVFGGLLTPSRRRRILESRTESTRAMVESVRGLPSSERPETLVCASAVGFYGSRADDLLEESAPPGEGFLADVCRTWEAAAVEVEGLGVRCVRLRFGIALAHDGGALPRIARLFRLGLGGRLGEGTQWLPWIHIRDAVGLVCAALGDAGYSGAINAVAPEPATNREFTRSLSSALKRPAMVPVPAFVLRAALGELASELLGSRRCVPAAATKRGFAFAFPELAAALADALGLDSSGRTEAT